MIRALIGTITLAFSFIVLWLHMSALQHSWYFYYLLFDIPMHFLGGFVAGGFFFFVYLVFTEGKGNEWFPVTAVGCIMMGAIGMGVAWEIFEFIFGLTASHDYVRDTVIDLLMDGAGGLTLSIFAVTLYANRDNVPFLETTSTESNNS